MSKGAARHINALRRERSRLVRHLEADEAWRELAALDADRASTGAEDGEAPAARAKLESALAFNPLYRALIKVDEAIAVLAADPEPIGPRPAHTAAPTSPPLPQRPSLLQRLSTLSHPAAVETAADPLEAERKSETDWLRLTTPDAGLPIPATNEVVDELSTENEAGAPGGETHSPPVSRIGVAEAEVTIVARGTPVLAFEEETDAAHGATPIGSLSDRLQHAQDFDAAHYAAYRGMVEEASVEIVTRDKGHSDPRAPS